VAVADKPADFAIDTNADAMLTRVSGAMANIILHLASQNTQNKTKSGLKLVTEKDVADSAEALSQALEGIEERTDVPATAKEAIVELRRMAQKLVSEISHGKPK
jgi:thioredoxin-like negative regulator of GroEL